jgi:DNA-binding CsgD family transcriptional regulator
VLDDLVESVRAGESRTLVLVGDAGIGKSALLEYTGERANGFSILRATGVESELDLVFSGLHQLCLPLLHTLDRLPEPQRDALSTAFGMSAGSPPAAFLVGLAVHSLVTNAARERPLLALIDDAQWLDSVSSQVLKFVARRLGAEPVGMIFTCRADEPTGFPRGLTELPILALRDADAGAVLANAHPWPMDEEVRNRIIRESHGNPLALNELAARTASQMAGGFTVPSAVPLVTRLEEGFMTRIDSLPADARTLVLLAALESTGDASVVWRAAAELMVDAQVGRHIDLSDLVTFGSHVRFHHPLVRSAACRKVDIDERREAHRALATVIDAEADPDRRAWHRAQAADGPDETVAAELEYSAQRAFQRGGQAAGAAFLEAAAKLTPNLALRGVRALAAAQAKNLAGASEDAQSLVELADSLPLNDFNRAQADQLRGQVAFFSGRGKESTHLLLDAARRIGVENLNRSREVYLDAVSAGLWVGRFADKTPIAAIAREAKTAPAGCGRPIDLLLDGFATLIADGLTVGTPIVKLAIKAFRDIPAPDTEAQRWTWLAIHAARDVWDHESADLISAIHVQRARQSGSLNSLPNALISRAGIHLYQGEFDRAEMVIDEISAVSAATGQSVPPYSAIGLAACRGDERAFTSLAPSALESATKRGDGLGFALIKYSGAVLYNSTGEYRKALLEAEAGAAYPHDLCYSNWALRELIEAASRTGELPRARTAFERLSESTRASGTAWALGVQARSHALISDDRAAEDSYREAIEHFAQTPLLFELARAHLIFGEWLRRAGRRVDARIQLRTAHDMFTSFGARAFAERTRRELAATGETVRKRSEPGHDELTAQEAQIARMAAAGQTNPEIGAELFISSRTVEWHLAKVYLKLGIGSRRELAQALGSRTFSR